MPPLLLIDIAGLTASLVLSTALVLLVAGPGIRRRLNRDFALFALMEAGWAGASLLLRLSLWFHLGRSDILLESATVFFGLMGPFLLLFVSRSLRVGGSWPTWTARGIIAVLLALTPLLVEKLLISNPVMSPDGLTFYRLTIWGFFAASIPALCILFSLGLFWFRRRHMNDPFIAVSVTFLFAGFLMGGLLQVRVPVMSITSTASVAILGWGIVRRQLFNPLRDLTADLRERAHRQELISQISRRTATLMNLDDLLLQAATLIRASFDYFTVGILLMDGAELVLRASTLPAIQAFSKRFRLKVGVEGICGWVAAHGTPLIVRDVSRDPRYVSLVENVRTRSELAVPIRRGDRVTGVLDIQSALLDAFTENDLRTQQTIADQLSGAIENARLYEETRRKAERLALVNRTSAAAGSVLDLNDLLETVYREVTPIFEADAFFIALYDVPDNMLNFRIQVDEGHREPPVREPLGSGLTSRVITERKPLLVNGPGRDAPEGTRPEAWGTGKVPSSWIGAPMRVGPRIIGVMSVQTYGDRHYDAEDLLLAATIADQVAVAVENARLYEEARLELEMRQRTEKGLRESEEKFRNLAEQSPNMIFIHGMGRVVYANRQCELSMGYTRAEIYAPGFDFQTLTAPGYESIVRENLRRHLRGEEVAPYEYVMLTGSGRRIDAILTTKLIQYEGEQAILGIVTDISARKRTERLLQSLNAAALAMEQVLTPSEVFPAALRVLSSLGLDCVVFLSSGDPAARRLSVDCWASGVTGEVRVTGEQERAERSFGYEAAAAIAEAMDGRAAVFTRMDQGTVASLHARGGVSPWPGRAAGSIAAVLSPLSVEDDILGLLVISGENLDPEDVQVCTAFAHQAAAAWRKTRLVRDLEGSLQQLRQAQEQLLHAQKMEAIGRLAGGIAHDFNNILTVISGYTSMLADAMVGNPPVLADLGQIRTTIKRASALTTRLLAFSRKQILQPTILDLNRVVANSATLLRPLIGEDIELSVRLAPGPVSVRADHYQIEQILMNLAVNARDAMPGGGRLVVETATAEVGPDGRALPDRPGSGPADRLPSELSAGSWVVLTVRDNGVGMSEDVQEHLFEPFFTTKEEGKGSGLGLSTVYGIVTQSGGRVRVESALGRGSTFTICIPQVPAAGERVTVEDGPKPPPTGSGTILLVEDEPDVRELSRRVLEKGGYRVIPVSSAREALLVAEGTAVIDLVISDVVMPGGISGVEMGERLSRSRPDLPILYISGYTDNVRFRDSAGQSRLPFLGKPFQPAEILAKVTEMLKKR